MTDRRLGPAMVAGVPQGLHRGLRSPLAKVNAITSVAASLVVWLVARMLPDEAKSAVTDPFDVFGDDDD